MEPVQPTTLAAATGFASHAPIGHPGLAATCHCGPRRAIILEDLDRALRCLRCGLADAHDVEQALARLRDDPRRSLRRSRKAQR